MTKCLDCDKIANFNYVGEKNGLYCFRHKLENMVYMKNKKYQYEGVKSYQISIMKMNQKQFIVQNTNRKYGQY